MSFIHSPQRIWLDLAVGSILLLMLGFGSVYIFRLNNDAREIEITSASAMAGQRISTDQGCIACHTVDGSTGVGPSWAGMWGRVETLDDGSTITVDDDYFRRSVEQPSRDIVAGYPKVMQRYFLEDEELDSLIAFAQSLK